MTRLTARRLTAIDAVLGERDRDIVITVGELGMMSGEQLRQVFFASGAKDEGRRASLKVLSRLAECEVLARLERRVGGVRRGSTGFIYVLGPAGQRLLHRWQGLPSRRARRPLEPGQQFVAHRLAVAQLFADLHVVQRYGEVHLVEFSGEPACWRSRIGAFGNTSTLKPDAYVKLTIDSRQLHWFIEVDMATESTSVIATKAAAYLAHYRSGIEQPVMPRVAWLVPSAKRQETLTRVLHDGSAPTGLHAVTQTNRAIELLKGGL